MWYCLLFYTRWFWTFEFVDEILKKDQWNESYWSVLFCSTVYEQFGIFKGLIYILKVGKASRNIVLKFINKFGISLACNHWNSQITFSSSLADYDLSPLEIQRWWLIWASNTVFHSLSVAHIEVAVFTGVKFLVIIPSSKILRDLKLFRS